MPTDHVRPFDGAMRVVTFGLFAVLAACSSPADDDASSAPGVQDLQAAYPEGYEEDDTTVDEVKATLHPTVASVGPDGTPIPQLHGVNLSGAEFAGSSIPGVFARDYTFPTNAEVDYYVKKGMDTFRLPFMWERLQPVANGVLDTTYLAKIDGFVKYATGKGAHVVLNPQNFGKYYTSYVGSTAVPNAVFADFWKKLAAKYTQNARVSFCLMNEPHGLSTEQWAGAAQAAITGIRSVGAKNVIMAPGNGWTGAWSWTQTGNYGTPNSVAMLKLNDPANNMVFEVHQYLDSNSGGQSAECASATIGSQRLVAFVKWLRDNNKKGFIGEFAGGRTPTCYAAIKDMMTYMNKNADVITGWLWWGGGPWWKTDYNFRLDPVNNVDQPQMPVIVPFL